MEGRIRPLRQRIAWVQHLVKVTIGHKERDRVLGLSRYFHTGSVVLDIGAHLGYMTKEFAACYGGSCRVVAFEPIGYTRSILRLVTAAQRNVIVSPYALSDATGCVDISIPLKASGTLGIGLAHIGPEAARDFVIERVQTTTLDDWFETSGLPTINFMKVDVEGAELLVLRGGGEHHQGAPPYHLHGDRPDLSAETIHHATRNFRLHGRCWVRKTGLRGAD